MHRKLTEGLLQVVTADELLALTVELEAAGSSSLDYAVLAGLAGSTAARYEPIKRALARLLVEACNENGWTIPFTQVTLHQAPQRGEQPADPPAGWGAGCRPTARLLE
jgi:hypothetical protein